MPEVHPALPNALIAATMTGLSAAHLHEVALIVGFISAAIQAVCGIRSRKTRRKVGRKPNQKAAPTTGANL